jgi:hypothetical protein
MGNSLYQDKVAIVSRLIKDSSLTLEEALLLLKEEDLEEEKEEEAVAESPVKYYPGWNNPIINTPNPYTNIGTLPTLYTRVTTGTGICYNDATTTTTVSNVTNSSFTVDLNN